MPTVYYKGDMGALSQYLKREYSEAVASRRAYERMLDENDRQYESMPRVARKTFPWPDASNLEVPVGATHVDTVHARLESSYFATQPNVRIRAFDEKWREHAAALEDYVNEISLPLSGWRDEKSADLLATAKLGTSFQWLGYDYKSKIIRDELGRKKEIVTHNGPIQQFVHPKHLIVPAETRSLENARWVTIRRYCGWSELIHMRNQRNGYNPISVDALDGRGIVPTEEVRRSMRQGINIANGPPQWQVNRTYCLYQPYRNADAEDIWVDWHWPSGIILTAYYNPYIHYQWPLSKSVYMQREGAFYGIGIMQMLSAIEEEITTIHNYCLDNMLASNTVMLFVKNTIKDLEIMPMGQIVMPGDEKSIRAERLGQPLSGQQVGELAANAYAEKRTGIGDSNIPRMSSFRGTAGVRTPATTTLALIGEGNKRFELAIENSKRADNVLLRQHVILLKQYWPQLREMAFAWNARKAGLIDTLLAVDTPILGRLLNIEVAASSSTINNEVEKNNMMILAQFMQQFNALFIQYVNLMQKAPQLELVIRKMLNGAGEFVERLLRVFGIRDPERFIASVDDIGTAASSEPERVNNDITQRFLDRAQFVSNGAVASDNGQAGNN